MLASAASIHTKRWVKGLADSGVSVMLLTQDAALAGDWGHNVVIHRLPFSGMLGYIFNAPFARSVFKKWGGNLLHAHYAGGYGLCASLTGIRPRVVSVWGADVYDVPRKGKAWKLVIQHILNSSDRVTSTSHVMLDQCRRIGVDRHIDVVAFGVDTKIFSPVKKSIDNPNEDIIVGTVKTMHEKYGIDTLIRSFALICPLVNGKSIRMKIIGGGPDLQNLKNLANELEISNYVEFTGHVEYEQVPEKLRELDIYCAPSRWDSESFGVAIIEASACGLPVIVSDAGGLPEVVLDGETGFVIKRDDVPGLATALETLIRGDTLRQKMGKNGRTSVIRRYEWSNCIKNMISIYKEAMTTVPS